MNSTENCVAPLYVVAVTTASCIISSLGSLAIIIIFILWPELRTEIRRILFYLSIACFFSVCAILPGVTDVLYDPWDSNLSNRSTSYAGCIAESAISTFFTTSSFFWTLALVLYLWLTVRTADYKCAGNLLTYFHIVCWGVPLVTTISALLFKRLGPTQNKTTVGWCWVNVTHDGAVWWMLLTGKAWELLACVALVVLCVLIRRQTTNQCSYPQRVGDFKGVVEKINKKVLLIALIFILSRVFDTVRFILAVSNSKHVWNHVLMALQGIGDTSQGLTNFILFCICTEKIRKRFSYSITKRRGPGLLHQEAKRLLENCHTVHYTS